MDVLRLRDDAWCKSEHQSFRGDACADDGFCGRPDLCESPWAHHMNRRRRRPQVRSEYWKFVHMVQTECSVQRMQKPVASDVGP